MAAVASAWGRARNGQRDGWASLVHDYVDLVWTIGVNHGLTDTEAEHAAQTTWLLLAQSLRTTPGTADTGCWLARTAVEEAARIRGREPLVAARHEVAASVARKRGGAAAQRRLPALPVDRQVARLDDLDLLLTDRELEASLGLPPLQIPRLRTGTGDTDDTERRRPVHDRRRPRDAQQRARAPASAVRQALAGYEGRLLPGLVLPLLFDSQAGGESQAMSTRLLIFAGPDVLLRVVVQPQRRDPALPGRSRATAGLRVTSSPERALRVDVLGPRPDALAAACDDPRTICCHLHGPLSLLVAPAGGPQQWRTSWITL